VAIRRFGDFYDEPQQAREARPAAAP